MSTRAERHSTGEDGTPCVRANSICKHFGDVAAVQRVTFDVAAGHTFALIGANGSGKSTLLRILYGLSTPDEGDVSVLGLDPFKEPKRIYKSARFLSQQFSLDHEMTGDETLKLFARLSSLPKKKFQQELSSAAQQFGLTDFLTRPIASWSGGMKQRLHLALCLLGDSKLMLLDEPTSNLDLNGKMDFWNWSKTYTEKGGTILLTTHDLKNAERYATKVILLDQGEVLLNDTPAKIIQQHGRPVIFATPGESHFSQQVITSLQSLETVSEIDFRENQVAIVLNDEHCKDAAIIAELEKQGVSVESYRRESGLAAAYYLLVGKQLANNKESKNGRRQGGRKRR